MVSHVTKKDLRCEITPRRSIKAGRVSENPFSCPDESDPKPYLISLFGHLTMIRDFRVKKFRALSLGWCHQREIATKGSKKSGKV
jgi:hypothetical protein